MQVRFSAISRVSATSNYVALLHRIADFDERASTSEVEIPAHRAVIVFDEDVVLLQVNAVAVGVIFLHGDDDARAGGDNRSADRHSDVNAVESYALVPASVMTRCSNDFI